MIQINRAESAGRRTQLPCRVRGGGSGLSRRGLVAGCIFLGGVGGLFLHRVLPRAHLTKETQDVIRLGIGMLSVLASLVLGLLIATAKTAYDTTDQSIRN